jgi:hypothetical protein
MPFFFKGRFCVSARRRRNRRVFRDRQRSRDVLSSR